MEHVDALRLIAGIAVLGVAAALDARTRRVPNRVWAIGGTVGLTVLASDLLEGGNPWSVAFGLIPIAVLFFDALWDRPALFEKDSGRTTAVVLLIYISALAGFGLFMLSETSATGYESITVPVISIIGMILLVYLFYAVRLLRGGADAKALMAIAVLVPHYPMVAGLPIFELDSRLLSVLEFWFPFALVTLLNAALLTLFVPLYYLVRNAVRRDLRLPLLFLGLRVPITEVPKFSWLMERIVDGQVEVRLMPRGRVHREEELLKLAEAGRTTVWVTPQIPFVVLILLGFLTAFAVGNIVFVVAGALG